MNQTQQSSPVLKILGIGCVILVVLGIAGGIGIYFLFQKGMQEGQRQIFIQYDEQIQTMAEDDASLAPLAGRVSQVREIAEEGGLSLTTFGVLVVVTQGSMMDNQISPEELQDLTSLLDDVLAEPRGEVADIGKYQQMMNRYQQN